VELSAALERAYAYAFNGHGKMLCSLLQPLDLQQSLLEYGMPAISDRLISVSDSGKGSISIDRANWPMKGDMPLLSSSKSMQIRYGEHFQYVSMIIHYVKLAA